MKRGRKFMIYGAFGTKTKAKRAQAKGKGRFIVERRIRGSKRYVVLKAKTHS